MTTTGQGLGANPLLGSAELPSVSNASGLINPPAGGYAENSNILKNNDFSNVLKRHWAMAEGREGGGADAPEELAAIVGAGAAKGAISFRDMAFSGKFTTHVAAEGGNALPVGGNEQQTAALSNQVGDQFLAPEAGGDQAGQGAGAYSVFTADNQPAASQTQGQMGLADGAGPESGVKEQSSGQPVGAQSQTLTQANASVEGSTAGTAGLVNVVGGESATDDAYSASSVNTASTNSQAGSVTAGTGAAATQYAGAQTANSQTNGVTLQQGGSGQTVEAAAGQPSSQAETAFLSQRGGRGFTFATGLTGSENTATGQAGISSENTTPGSAATAGQNPTADTLFTSQLQSLNGKPLFQQAVEGKRLTTEAKLGIASLTSALSGQGGDNTSLSPGTGTATPTLSHSYTTSDSATLQTAVPVPVGKPGWNETVMQRVMWMSSQQINKAEIALDPPELGPLHVKISSQGEQTSVVFSSAHGAVRDALDQGLPRLREMLENQGLNLADVDVSDHSASQQQAQGDSFNGDSEEGHAGSGNLPEGTEASVDAHAPAVVSKLSLVDQYV